MKNLEIVVKGSYLQRRVTENFLNVLKSQITPQIKRKFKFLKNISRLRLMIFDTFEFYDMIEDGVVYYPILFEHNGDEGFVWVCWPALTEDGESIGLGSDDIPEFVKFTVCKNVPQRIEHYVKSLQIHMSLAKTIFVTEGVPYSVSQIFLYRFAEQISPKLSQILNVRNFHKSGYKIKLTGNSYLGQSVFKDDVYSYSRLKFYDKSGVVLNGWVKWKSHIPGKKYIETDDPIIPLSAIEFDIPSSVPLEILKQANEEDFNDVDLFAQLKKTIESGEKKKQVKNGKYYFKSKIDYSSFPYSDIKIIFTDKIRKETETELEMFYWNFVQRWNSMQKQKLFKRMIYDISDVARINDTTIVLKTSFGNCTKRALDEFLRCLDESVFDIEKVVVS